jgi:hypothetical protein
VTEGRVDLAVKQVAYLTVYRRSQEELSWDTLEYLLFGVNKFSWLLRQHVILILCTIGAVRYI